MDTVVEIKLNIDGVPHAEELGRLVTVLASHGLTDIDIGEYTMSGTVLRATMPAATAGDGLLTAMGIAADIEKLSVEEWLAKYKPAFDRQRVAASGPQA
jgi:hypothetical protein